MDEKEAKDRVEHVREELRRLDLGQAADALRDARDAEDARTKARHELKREREELELEIDAQEEKLEEIQAKRALAREDDEGSESDRELAQAGKIVEKEKERDHLDERIHELHEVIGKLDDKIDEKLKPRVEARRQRRAKLLDRKRGLVRRLEEIRESQQTDLGEGPWGGAMSVAERIIAPVYARHGIPVTSRKRPASDPLSISNPSSDHNEANTTAYALDAGTANNFTLAKEVVAELTAAADQVIEGTWAADYDSISLRFGPTTMRVQIIAGTHGTGPHLHVGLRS